MGSRKITRLILTAILIPLTIKCIFAQGDIQVKQKTLNKNQDAASPYTYFNINKISSILYNNLISDNNPVGNSGLIYPKGSGKGAIFEGGFAIAGKAGGKVRASGTFFFQSGFLPGRILNGQADEKYASRIFRVRRDFRDGNFASEIADKEGSEAEIRSKYEKDWNEWPAEDGAPFDDKDGNGRFDPETDIPGVPGADQTVWFVVNDVKDTLRLNNLGSDPLVFEIYVTVWGYKNKGVFDNMMFKSFRLVNKSRTKIDSMYVMIMSDPDLGDAGDDYTGCDTLLGLGYSYNAFPRDADYGYTPPALGYCFIQGPRIKGNPSDAARFMGREIRGEKNLGMTSFKWGHKNDPIDPEVYFGSGNYEKGALMLFKYMKGLNCFGLPLLLPKSMGAAPTRFQYSGDPVAGTGFIGGMQSGDGVYDRPQDHRMGLSSGPFIMSPGDTQEVIIAQIAAGGPNTSLGHLASINTLKAYTRLAKLLVSESSSKPAAPAAEASGLDRNVIINWGKDPEAAEKNEALNAADFSFEGYNVYQLPSPLSGPEDGIKIATFDRINDIGIITEDADSSGTTISRVRQAGYNSGIQYYMKLDRDYLTGGPLVNGKKYFYSVTAYSATANTGFPLRDYESGSAVLTAVPRQNDPGVRYGHVSGEKLNVSRLSGFSSGSVTAEVIDPSKVTGHGYRVWFEKSGSGYTWNVTDVTLHETKISGQINQSGDNEYFLIDGVLLRVTGPSSGKINTENDSWHYSTRISTMDINAAKSDVSRINVFPNPYYALNTQETSKYQRYVTFNHLPEKATIRIFNLAGELVRTIIKNSSGQFAEWDLQNEAQYPAGSGLYIVHIEMPDLGMIKTLKLCVIQEQVIPDHF